MSDFLSNSSDAAKQAVQNGMSMLVGALQPDSTTAPGAAVLNGSVAFNKPISYNSIVTLASAATVSLDPTLTNFFHYQVPGATSINAASAPVGESLYLKLAILTSGVSMAVTFGTKFKPNVATLNTGTANAAQQYIMQFISDGLNFLEVSRTTAE